MRTFAPLCIYIQGIDKEGKTRHRSVLCLGELPGFSKEERDSLARMLTTMIEEGQSVMCENRKLYEEAISQYVKYYSSVTRRTAGCANTVAPRKKRDDCKTVVLAAVVNTEGLLVRTMIYEGNRSDSTTLEEVVESLAGTTFVTRAMTVSRHTSIWPYWLIGW